MSRLFSSSSDSWTNTPEKKPKARLKGLGLLLGGLLLFLCAFSYSAHPLAEVARRENYFGPVGYYLAWCGFWLWGWGTWLVCFLLMGGGLAQLIQATPFTKAQKWGAVSLFFFSLILLGTQTFTGLSWAKSLGVSGPGGIMGLGLGPLFFASFLGSSGTLALFLPLYFLALIYVFGLKPYEFFVLCWAEYKNWQAKRKAKKAELDALYSNPKEVMEQEEKQARSGRKSSHRPSEALLPIDDDSEGIFPQQGKTSDRPQWPEPQIIDASQSRPRTSTKDTSSLLTPGKESEYLHYQLPSFDLLHYDEKAGEQTEADKTELFETQQKILNTLKSFDIDVTPGNITKGPTITRYEIYPSHGLRVSKIAQVEADIARATRAERINILAPIPGKDTVGIEIANSKKHAVPLREILQDEAFSSQKKRIPIALGKDVYGNVVVGDLAAMPHLLVAGATGSGKSVCINTIISSILYKFRPDELRFILVDPKVVELRGYAKLPHLIIPVVTEPKKVLGALRWSVNEMEKRYRIFADVGVRNFEAYNNRPREEKETTPVPSQTSNFPPPSPHATEELPSLEEDADFIEELASSLEKSWEEPKRGQRKAAFYEEEEDDEEEEDPQGSLFLEEEEEEEIPDKFPYIVIIIDELADLMQTAPKDIEGYIARLAQKARAAGIHLIVATQSPRKDVLTGLIKANIPSRIAFQVSSALDSRIILDTGGAEKLVGKGDLLYLPPGSAKLERAQGAFISDEEVVALVEHCAAQSEQSFLPEVQEQVAAPTPSLDSLSKDFKKEEEDEDLLERCKEVILAEQRASISLVQRRLRIGYNRAADLIDLLEKEGFIGPSDGTSKPREILRK